MREVWHLTRASSDSHLQRHSLAMVSKCTLLTMDGADAMRYAGPEAVWVDMSADDALTLFNIDIKAGSTGKPKALADRESWGTLMPLIEGMIDRVGNARMMGQEWAAKPWIELLAESSKRLDDPLEVEKFLPEVPDEVVQANMNKQPSEDEVAETENTKADTSKKEADTIKSLAEALEKQPLFAKNAIQAQGMKAAQEQGSQPPPPQNEIN